MIGFKQIESFDHTGSRSLQNLFASPRSTSLGKNTAVFWQNHVLREFVVIPHCLYDTFHIRRLYSGFDHGHAFFSPCRALLRGDLFG